MADEPKSYVLQNMIDDCVQVVELRRVGQRFVYDDDQVGYPYYIYDAQPVGKFDSMKEAKAFLRGLERATFGTQEGVLADIETHPTFTMSVGGAGHFPLDPDGGPLYMTNTDMPNVGQAQKWNEEETFIEKTEEKKE